MKFVFFLNVRRLIAAAFILALPAQMVLAGVGHGTASPSGEKGKAAEVTRTITVVMRDSLFDRQELYVRPGETVRFILKNEGELLHEFNIGYPSGHAKHQKEMLRMMEMGMLAAPGMAAPQHDSGHDGSVHVDVGDKSLKHDDPNSVLVKPGETKELIWRLGRISDLEYACNLPGHYQSGMVGRFKVGS